MAVGIGASGVIGLALEATSGTYLAPTYYFPFTGESISWTQDTNWRRVIRGTADVVGAVAGNGHVEGSIDMELLEDALPYFLNASRGTSVKSGTTPDFVYTFGPTHVATPPKTLSLTIVRNGISMGYVGCVVTGMNFTVENGQAMASFSILGTAEASQAVPTATYVDTGPFGEGKYTVEIPTATAVFDTDNFNLSIDDGGQVANRLKATLGAQFIHFGERSVTLSVDRDFESRAEYDIFKALTSRSITIKMSKSAARYVNFVVPSAIVDDYSVNLGGVGDLVRASVTYQGVHNATQNAGYQIIVGSATNIT